MSKTMFAGSTRKWKFAFKTVTVIIISNVEINMMIVDFFFISTYILARVIECKHKVIDLNIIR